MKFKSLIVTSLLVVCVVSLAQAQRERTVFNSFGLTGIWGGTKHQLAQFDNSQSYMRGGYFGLEFGKALFVGFSNTSLKSDVNWDQVQDQKFGLNWRGGTVGYGFMNHRAIHPMVNVDFGPGKVRLDNTVDRIFVVQPSAGVEINVFRWLHLGLEGGYRFVSDSGIEGLTDQALSGAFGQASLKFGWSWGKSHYNKRKKERSNASSQQD